eukprot:1525549-Prymnesium_polylepis.1
MRAYRELFEQHVTAYELQLAQLADLVLTLCYSTRLSPGGWVVLKVAVLACGTLYDVLSRLLEPDLNDQRHRAGELHWNSLLLALDVMQYQLRLPGADKLIDQHIEQRFSRAKDAMDLTGYVENHLQKLESQLRTRDAETTASEAAGSRPSRAQPSVCLVICANFYSLNRPGLEQERDLPALQRRTFRNFSQRWAQDYAHAPCRGFMRTGPHGAERPAYA